MHLAARNIHERASLPSQRVRRCPTCGAHSARQLPVDIDFYGGTATAGGVTVALQPALLIVLEGLAFAYPRGMPRARLIAMLYDDPSRLEDADACLSAHISKLRRLLREAGLPLTIVSRFRLGVRLLCEGDE